MSSSHHVLLPNSSLWYKWRGRKRQGITRTRTEGKWGRCHWPRGERVSARGIPDTPDMPDTPKSSPGSLKATFPKTGRRPKSGWAETGCCWHVDGGRETSLTFRLRWYLVVVGGERHQIPSVGGGLSSDFRSGFSGFTAASRRLHLAASPVPAVGILNGECGCGCGVVWCGVARRPSVSRRFSCVDGCQGSQWLRLAEWQMKVVQ